MTSSFMHALFRVVTDETNALQARDRALVPIMAMLASAMSTMEPEEMVASLVATSGGIVLSAAAVGCCGRRMARKLGILIGFAMLAAAAMLLVALKDKPVDQKPENYGKLAFNSIEDLPNLPPIEGKLMCEGPFFKDELGRVLLLRGVNLGGDTKVPTKPYGATFEKRHFYDTKGVSFVGRPFPLEEADEHLGRLRSWGFTFLRFLITWEAVEHDGPGEYDSEYLEYLRAVIRKCAEHGISVFIDPHQDVWSRWTGGDGAPAWTLTKVGFKLENLFKSGAALNHQEHGDPLPQMEWPTNYNRLAAATMFTLFFAGNTFAPNTKVDGEPVQEYLQGHYLNAMKQVATYLKDEPNVLGYDTLNEPSTGYIGLKDLNRALFPAPMGAFFSGFNGMVLGAGRPLEIPYFSKALLFQKYKAMNPEKSLAWQSHSLDVWRNEKVWEFDSEGKPKLLRPDHFARNSKGENVHFMRDFMTPFFEKFRTAIHSVHPDVVIFAEPYIDPNSPVHDNAPSTGLTGDRYAWAPHYYDALTLLFKKSRSWAALDIEIELPVFGPAAQRAITKNLGHVKHTGSTLGGRPGGGPVLVGETGISMDQDRDENGFAKAYSTGDFSSQIRSLDRTMTALDSNLLSFTLWNYSPMNNNKRGDLWNDEDLSLFSRDQQTVPASEDIHSGGRALQAAVRPYPMKTCGVPDALEFQPLSTDRVFAFSFSNSDSCDPESAPTIIFIPSYQYPHGVNCSVLDGSFEYDQKNQIIQYKHDVKVERHAIICAAIRS